MDNKHPNNNADKAREYNRGASSHAGAEGSEAAEAVERRPDEHARAEREGKERIAATDTDPEMAAATEMLSPEVRRRAIERATRLVEQGYTNRQALRMAIVVAEEWANQGRPSSDLPGPAVHVLFESGSWRVCSEDGTVDPLEFSQLDDAVQRAHRLATEHSSSVYVHDAEGGLIDVKSGYGADLDQAARSQEGESARRETAPGESAPSAAEQGEIDGAFHVIPFDEHWALKRTGPEGLFSRFDTKREAVARGRELARQTSSQLVIHAASGEVQRRHNYP